MNETPHGFTDEEQSLRESAIDRIREILVGAPLSEVVTRINQINSRLHEQITLAQQANESQLKRLESDLKKEINDLQAEYERNDANSKSALDSLSENQKALRAELNNAIQQQGERFSGSLVNLQRRLDEQMSGLMGRLDSSREDIIHMVVHQAQLWLDSEPCRNSLAKLVSDLVRNATSQLVTEMHNRKLVTPEERERMIRSLAHRRAQQRGFVGGSQLQDWREAEAEVERVLSVAVDVRDASI
jgi:hypothetical protein